MTKYIHFAIVCLILISTGVNAQVMTGLDRLVAEHFVPLKGKHIGLITNETGLTRDGMFGRANQHARC